MTGEQISAVIMAHLKGIKSLLEANGGCQYLTMTMFEDGEIMFNNGYMLKNVDSKGLTIQGYEKGGDGGNG